VCRAISRQWLGKHIPAATDTHATTEVLLEIVSATQSMQRIIRWTTETKTDSKNKKFELRLLLFGELSG
jgi:hypothetical protein